MDDAAPTELVREGHRAALVAGFLGWTLDAFDLFLVIFSLTAIAEEFHRPDKDIAECQWDAMGRMAEESVSCSNRPYRK